MFGGGKKGTRERAGLREFWDPQERAEEAMLSQQPEIKERGPGGGLKN